MKPASETVNPWPIQLKTLRIGAFAFSCIFAVVMLGTNLGWFFIWEDTLPGRVYLNTDDGDGGGYLNPGGWVGTHGAWPVVTLEHLTQDTPMNDPDELLKGWSITRLLVIWCCMFGSSIIPSVWLASLPWVNLASVAWRILGSRLTGKTPMTPELTKSPRQPGDSH